MRWILFLFSAILMTACSKTTDQECYPDAPVSRELVNKKAKVVVTATEAYLVEEASLDSRLLPCNLPEAYRMNNLQVIVSGKVKAVIQGGPGPCCTEPFFITQISR